jgi:hypothetical protein
MAKKFIINDGDLIFGNVDFHENLIPKDMERSKTVGGGYWYKSSKTIYFYGSSFDFGKATKEQFDAAIKSPSIEKIKIIFSTEESLEKTLKLTVTN